MPDGRKNNGGARPGAGRPRKDVEDKAKALSIKALVKEFGSEEEAFNHCARKAKDPDERKSFEYFRLIIERAYGKPKENININPDNDFNVPITSFFGLGCKDKGEG